MSRYPDEDKYDIYIIIKRRSISSRLKQDLDLDFLPYTFTFIDIEVDMAKKLKADDKAQIDKLAEIEFSGFNFFQEQDPVTIVLINKYAERGTKINLFQDGLKAYIFNTMKFSLGLVTDNIKQNKWIKMNGYPVKDKFSFLRCRKYSFLKYIDEVFVTFPEAYDNWNKKPIGKLPIIFRDELWATLKRVFKWEDSLLPVKDKVIFFMNQPLGDNGAFDISILQKLQAKYPTNELYIKLHPLTPQATVEEYKKLNNITIITSKIPAEIFISEITNSIVLSVYSGSMFINNESCNFYWLHNIKEDNNVSKLKRYRIINPTKHIVSANGVDEIVF